MIMFDCAVMSFNKISIVYVVEKRFFNLINIYEIYEMIIIYVCSCERDMLCDVKKFTDINK